MEPAFDREQFGQSCEEEVVCSSGKVAGSICLLTKWVYNSIGI